VHTPGKWQIEDRNFVYVLDSESGTNRFWAGLSAGFIGTGERTSAEEIYANARLIAAAPDLLEALRSLMDDIGNDGIACPLSKNMALEAITKATGETK